MQLLVLSAAELAEEQFPKAIALAITIMQIL
jgi:hypothetical protein